jgi:hypothetical protein
MEQYLAALSAVGGFAGLGAVIDLALYRDRKKVEAYGRAWRRRFIRVKWSNFGRRESEEAISLLDKLAGTRLLSWRRLEASLIVLACSATLAITATLVATAISAMRSSKPWVDVFSAIWQRGDNQVQRIALYVLSLTFLLALSLTVLRLIAGVVARFAPRGLAGFCFFLGLAAVHVLLLLFWENVVTFVASVPMFVIGTVNEGTFPLADLWSHFRYTAIESPMDHWRSMFHLLRFDFSHPFTRLGPQAEIVPPTPISAAQEIGGLIRLQMDFASNGVRLLFAGAFLSSYLFGAALQPFISRVWEGLIRTKKPFFTSIFAGFGGIFALVQALVS